MKHVVCMTWHSRIRLEQLINLSKMNERTFQPVVESALLTLSCLKTCAEISTQSKSLSNESHLPNRSNMKEQENPINHITRSKEVFCRMHKCFTKLRSKGKVNEKGSFLLA